MWMTRKELLQKGQRHISDWCASNGILAPDVEIQSGESIFGVCAYYRSNRIFIWTESCARIGRVGRQWSYPGYVVDRTPYGVLAHELAHHVDSASGAAGGSLSHAWFSLTGAEPLTSYAPNTNEWFAEIFRLFVTNPDLLSLLRPHCYQLMNTKWKSVETRPWEVVLQGAERNINAARNKIKRVKKTLFNGPHITDRNTPGMASSTGPSQV